MVIIEKGGRQAPINRAEEGCFACKDIDEAMEQQRDLARPVKRLKRIGVVKG